MTFLLIFAAVSGCVSVREFEDIRREVGQERYLDIDGRQVYVEISGDGEPVLFIHGFGASSYSWAPILPEISSSFRTIAVDLYGFGFTERPDEWEPYTRSGQVDLARGVLDALGLQSAHVIGHSYGGAISMTLAHQFPERVRSLTLIDSAAPDYPSVRRRPFVKIPGATWMFLRGVALREPFVEWVMRKSYERPDLVVDEHVEAYRDRLRVEGIAHAYRGLSLPRNDDADLAEVPLEEIRQPALVLWGEDDRLIPVEDGRAGAERLPDHRFVSYPDCGHSPHEEHPQQVAAEILRFLHEQSDRPRTEAELHQTVCHPSGARSQAGP